VNFEPDKILVLKFPRVIGDKIIMHLFQVLILIRLILMMTSEDLINPVAVVIDHITIIMIIQTIITITIIIMTVRIRIRTKNKIQTRVKHSSLFKTISPNKLLLTEPQFIKKEVWFLCQVHLSWFYWAI